MTQDAPVGLVFRLVFNETILKNKFIPALKEGLRVVTLHLQAAFKKQFCCNAGKEYFEAQPEGQPLSWRNKITKVIPAVIRTYVSYRSTFYPLTLPPAWKYVRNYLDFCYLAHRPSLIA